LESLTSIKKLGISFLQNQGAWIFFPRAVEFQISKDGNIYNSVKRIQFKTEINPAYEVKEVSADIMNEKVRYVRVKAENISVCPEWHPGAGGKAWLFIDEIVVK
ncbi:MAG: glycoside hydrolase family 92 protein, partial [bacterium]